MALFLQACLGASAKEGERNVITVKTEDIEGEEVEHSILSLTVGGTEQVRPGLGGETKVLLVASVWLDLTPVQQLLYPCIAANPESKPTSQAGIVWSLLMFLCVIS